MIFWPQILQVLYLLYSDRWEERTAKPRNQPRPKSKPVAAGEHLNRLPSLHRKTGARMDIPIPEFSREQIPRYPYEKEIRSIDPALFKPIPSTLQPIMPLLKAIYQRTAPKEPEKAPDLEPKPLPESPYMDFNEASAYLRLTERQLKDLCRDQRITHARIDYRTFRFKKARLGHVVRSLQIAEEIGLRLNNTFRLQNSGRKKGVGFFSLGK